MRRELRCPSCGASLVESTRWFGLKKTYASPCAECGAELGFDTTGGVWLLDAKGTQSATPSETEAVD